MATLVDITDLSDPRLDVYVRLTGAQLRSGANPSAATFIAESPIAIDVALKAGCKPLSMLTERRLINSTLDGIISRLGDVPVYVGSRELLTGLTGFALTRGALCAFRRPETPPLSALLSSAHRIAVLEGITDSTNIGAVFRSAAGLGMDAVLVTPTCCDPLCRRAVRVSMGTVLQVPWAQIGESSADWPEKGMEILHGYGFSTVAMALRDDSLPLDDEGLRREEKLAILLGTEGDGLARETIAACDYTVRIPMKHGVDSLNVAAAGAVAFWELRERK